MKKPIEKRLNIALDAEDWQTLNEYMEAERINQTQAIRQLLRDWKKRRETAVNVSGSTTYIPPLIGDSFGRVTTPKPKPENIACSGCGKISEAELNADGIWAYPFALFRYVDGRILCADCNEKENNNQ